jgi:hypothetical protein
MQASKALRLPMTGEKLAASANAGIPFGPSARKAGFPGYIATKRVSIAF